MATTNSYRPTVLSFNSYGWRGAPQYNRADVPTRWVEGATQVDRNVLEQQMAYEWLASGSNPSLDTGMASNPPFTKGSAGRIIPGLTSADGHAPRILRGFIRRAEYDVSDPVSMARLYFMYNPETITRDYVSYLDQGALDPFNTIYQSGNLVAPPSFMDFTFSLLFDRQEEAMQADYPGVFVDYKFFDLVVRNVTPTSNATTNTGLPDNGVMMVNPRDITVVFSPQLTVQGRPSNARVSFTKFTHRMVPVRMQVDLTIRVVYFGPMRDAIPYTKETEVQAASIPWREDMGATFAITDDDIKQWKQEQKTWASQIQEQVLASLPDAVSKNIAQQRYQSQTGSASLNAAIMEYASQQAIAAGAIYSGQPRGHLWHTTECSTFVWGGFAYFEGASPSYAEDMHWPGPAKDSNGKPNPIASKPNDSGDQLSKCISGKSPVTKIFGTTAAASAGYDVRSAEVKSGYMNLLPGDLLFRSRDIGSGTQRDHNNVGHVAWFHHWADAPGGSLFVCDSAGPGITVGVPRPIAKELLWADYNWAFRPNLVGGDMSANNGSIPV